MLLHQNDEVLVPQVRTLVNTVKELVNVWLLTRSKQQQGFHVEIYLYDFVTWAEVKNEIKTYINLKKFLILTILLVKY